MKQDTTLFIFALVLAFLTGNITYLIKSDQKVDVSDIQELNEINVDIQRDYAPLLRLDLNNDYPTPSHVELLKAPKIISTRTTDPNVKNCLKNKFNQMRTEFLDKETLWLSFRCKHIRELPKDFFKTAPYMHPNGSSYAYMFYTMLERSSSKQRWYLINARYMHLNELKTISWPLSQSFQFLYSIDQNIINRILGNEKVIYAEDFYLLRTGNLKYFVLDGIKATKVFSRAGYQISSAPNGCFIKIGNVCWKRKSHNVVSFLSQTSIIIFIVTVFVLFLTANALYVRIRQKKQEEERKKHALRVLTHELRTPVASLLLKINHLSDQSTELDEDLQANITSIESDIYRLKHLAEKSKSYLQTDSGEVLDLKPAIFDVRDLGEEILNEYAQENIKLEIKDDFQIETDHYWLKMCITNIIENAIRYGKPPIKLNIYQDKKFHYFSIQDEGHIKYLNLKELTTAKHHNTKGLGLGLIIIQKTIQFLNGELIFTPTPTTFTIKLKRSIS